MRIQLDLDEEGMNLVERLKTATGSKLIRNSSTMLSPCSIGQSVNAIKSERLVLLMSRIRTTGNFKCLLLSMQQPRRPNIS